MKSFLAEAGWSLIYSATNYSDIFKPAFSKLMHKFAK